MRIYFDTSALNRPFDDRSQTRIEVEAEAVLQLLDLAVLGTLEFVSSEVVTHEIRRTPDDQRRTSLLKVAGLADETLPVTAALTSRARELGAIGFKAFDSLHIAVAESGNIDFFCTCDDRLLKKSRATANVRLRVVSPIECLEELER